MSTPQHHQHPAPPVPAQGPSGLAFGGPSPAGTLWGASLPDAPAAPPDPDSEAQALAARGVTLRLNDGRTHQVTITFATLLVLEERFGGIGGMRDRLKPLDGMEQGALSGESIGAVVDVFHALLWDVFPEGKAGRMQCAAALDLSNLQHYMDVLGLAFAQAFKTSGGSSTSGEAGPFPGPPSGDSPSPTAAPPNGSGA